MAPSAAGSQFIVHRPFLFSYSWTAIFHLSSLLKSLHFSLLADDFASYMIMLGCRSCCHKLQQTQKFNLSQFRRQKSEIKVSSELHSLQRLREPFLASSSPGGSRNSLSGGCLTLISAFIYFSVCIPSSFSWTSVTGFRAHPEYSMIASWDP